MQEGRPDIGAGSARGWPHDADHGRTGRGSSAGRIVVGIGAAVSLAVAGVVCLLVVLFAPALHRGAPITGAVAFGLITVVAAVGAVVAAIRSRTHQRAAVAGCGTLLAGYVVGIGVLVLLLV